MPKPALVALAALVLLALVYGMSTPVASMGSDDAQYLHAAQSLSAGQGWRGLAAGNEFWKWWPPGFPVLLALFGAQAVNAAALVMLVAGAAAVVYLDTGRAWLGVLAGALVFLSDAVRVWEHYATSDLTFAALVVVWLLSTRRVRTPGGAVASGLVAAAALMVRWPGAVCVAVTGALVLWQGRVRWAVAAVTPAAVLAGAWVVYLYAATGDLPGVGGPARFSVDAHLSGLAAVAAAWLPLVGLATAAAWVGRRYA